jgi:hypothetical protein
MPLLRLPSLHRVQDGIEGIRMQVLPPIDLQEMYGDEPDWDQSYDYVTSTMQVALSSRAARTILPGLG